MKRPDEFNPDTKGEKREKMRKKEQQGPTGGSWAAQAKRAQVNKNYEGMPPSLLPEIRIRVKKNRKK
ncbi:MAG: hypothetical protein AAB400_01560 [Patescibacteria group bacterium]